MENQNSSQAAAVNVSSQEMQFSANAVAAVSYVCPIVGVVALNAKPYSQDPTIRFHAWQAILTGAAMTLGYMVLSVTLAIMGAILSSILGMMNLFTVIALGFKVFSLGMSLLGLGLFLGWAFMVFQAATGKRFLVPLIGKHAERLAAQG